MNTILCRFPARKLARAVPLALTGAGLLASAMAASAAQAQDAVDRFDLSGSVALGAEYDSNLNVSELESAAGESDTAAVMEAGLDLAWRPAERWSAAGGYSYSASRYQDLDDYDLDMHLLFGDLSYDFDLLTLGGSYYYADAGLGGDDFLALNQYSAYAGKLFGERWYLRGALNFSEKSFETFEARDADNAGYGLDAYWFFNQGRGNLMLAYAFEDEETRDPQFAYRADTLRLRYSQRFPLAALDARLQLGYRWHDRDYGNITSSIAARRNDRQGVADVSLDVTLMENLELISRWEHGNYRSNLDSADYSSHQVSVSARLGF